MAIDRQKRVAPRSWSKAEDNLLYNLVVGGGEIIAPSRVADWKRIQVNMKWRTAEQMRARYRRMMTDPNYYNLPVKSKKSPRIRKCSKKEQPSIAEEETFLALDEYVRWRQPSAMEIGGFPCLDLLR